MKKPDGWLLERQIDHAKTLLRRKTVPYAEIATLCGFATPDHFVRAFTASVGLSPTVWRRQMLH
ncbi:helix-turn-helix domain-containing protein [Rhizobium daejeonense]